MIKDEVVLRISTYTPYDISPKKEIIGVSRSLSHTAESSSAATKRLLLEEWP
jgi:hypothetical protein